MKEELAAGRAPPNVIDWIKNETISLIGLMGQLGGNKKRHRNAAFLLRM